jgi:GNAT superfamily N-acetyltransferase
VALRLDLLTEADLPAAVALSTEAGWNQTTADWRRLLALAPRGCLAGRLDGALVATATRVEYGRVGWIGMVLVRKACRGRGFGTAILEQAVGPGPCGLDATELGRPLYQKLGFADVAPIDRWVGTLRAGAHQGRVEPLGGHLQAAVAFDQQACGVSRADLLEHLAGEPDVRQWVALDEDRIVGLASLRRGREHWHLGPITCADASVLDRLLVAAADQLGHHTLLVDAIRDDARSAVLAARGLRVQRRLMRMTRPGGQGMLMGPQVAAATAFEWG